MKTTQKEWAGKVSEKVFMAQVRQLARMCGWATYHTWNSFRSTEGFPDLVMVRAPRLIFAELKSAKGKLTIQQEAWLALFITVPRIEVYLWRPSDWNKIERILKR